MTWTMSSSPTVSSYSTHNGEFTINNVVLDINGSYITTNLSFETGGTFGGGLSDQQFDLDGPQLFTGLVNDPTFKIGTFTLTSDSDSFSYCDSGTYKLTITDPTPTSVTPEPSSVLLLATGILALVGAGVTKRFAA
jgi:hypothetical protein